MIQLIVETFIYLKEVNEIHSYEITVYALDTEKLDLDENANLALVGSNIDESHTIQKASLIFYTKGNLILLNQLCI